MSLKNSQPVMAESPSKPKQNDVPEKYEIENAADTLMKAQEIRNDKRLMPHVHRHLNKKKKAVIRSIDDLKSAAKERTAELQKGPQGQDNDEDDQASTSA